MDDDLTLNQQKKQQFICSKNLGLGPTGAYSLNMFWKLKKHPSGNA